MSSSKISFYHYTSRDGLNSILIDGFICESSHARNHAHFGEGTYGTTLPPDKGRKAIAKNNWTRHWRFYVGGGKVDRAIQVRIPKREVRKVGRRSGRDILLYPGGHLHLDEYRWKAWTVPKKYYTSSPTLLRKSAPKGHVSSSRKCGIKCASSDSESSDTESSYSDSSDSDSSDYDYKTSAVLPNTSGEVRNTGGQVRNAGGQVRNTYGVLRDILQVSASQWSIPYLTKRSLLILFSFSSLAVLFLICRWMC